MPSSISSSKPLGLLFGIALYAAAERAVWSSDDLARFFMKHQPYSSSADALGVTARIELAHRAEGSVVLLGSSQVREGIDCQVLETIARSPCVNLAIGGGSPLDLLHISSELGPAPARTTVISLFPGILHKAPKSGFIDARSIALLAGSDAWAAVTADDARVIGLGLLQSLSPTLRHREALREMFQELKADWPRSLEQDRSRTLRRMTDRDLQPAAYFTDRLGHVDTDVEVSPYTRTQDMALDLLIDRESAWGQRVLVIDFPTRPGYESTLSPAVLAHYEARLQRLRARGVRVVSSIELGLVSEADFIDFTHLNAAGGRRITEGLAVVLAGGGPRP
jgi:hypothetical protein